MSYEELEGSGVHLERRSGEQGLREGGWSKVPLREISSDKGWHQEDPVCFARLRKSLSRFGQLRPLIVGVHSSGGRVLLDGRMLFAAMMDLGWEEAWAIDVGPIDEAYRFDVMAALLCGHEVDYPQVAYEVEAALIRGVLPDDLALRSPFDPDRIKDLATLARWDWSIFDEDTEQPLIDWNTATEEVSVPITATVEELVREVEMTPPGTSVAEVIQHLTEHRKREKPGQSLFEF